METTIFSLHLRIVKSKQRLLDLAEKYGRTDTRVLAYSRKLDKMIVEFQRTLKL